MDSIETFQQKLLEQIRFANRGNPISEITEAAYRETPRHLFVSRYRRIGSKDWYEVDAGNRAQHLPAVYTNTPLILAGEDDTDITSTVSQPSLVLRMLDMLRVEPGQNIFELGAGSGWNAALLGRLAGAAGHVYSVEILPDIAKKAARTIETLAIRNVSIIEGDGGAGYVAGAPYDRAIFTAGTYDLPRYFYAQVKDGGLLLVVIKIEGGGDCLVLLKKTGDHFESMESMACAFVQMAGSYRIDSLEPICLEQLPEWSGLQQRELARTPFWWGGAGKETFIWRTLGIRSFLAVTEPLFQVFKTGRAPGSPYEEQYFGLWDRTAESLVVARDDALVSYGTPAAKERLMQHLEQWLKLGMPTTASLTLQILPSRMDRKAAKNQWIVKRSESQFVWSLPG